MSAGSSEQPTPVKRRILPATAVASWRGSIIALVFSGGCLFGYQFFRDAEFLDPSILVGDVISLSVISFLTLVGTALGVRALRLTARENNSTRTIKFWAAIVANGLACLLSAVGFIIGGWVYLAATGYQEKVAREYAERARAKHGDGEAYDLELAKSVNWAYQEKLSEVQKTYELAGKTISEPPVLDMAEVGTRAELQSRLEMVQEYIAASAALNRFSKRSIKIYESELSRQHFSPGKKQEILNEFIATARKVDPFARPLRELDVQRGKVMLKMISILESSWGKWEHLQDQNLIQFEAPATLKAYQKAASELARIEGEMDELTDKIQSLRSLSEEAGP